MRSSKVCNKRSIDHVCTVDIAEIFQTRVTRFGGEVFIIRDLSHNAECVVSAETNYSYAAASERRGKCDDRIHEIHFNTHNKKEHR